MKRLALLCMMLLPNLALHLMFFQNSSVPALAAVDDTALEVWWSFDEASGNALDSVGSNDLVETSGTIASVAGKVGNARQMAAADTEWFQLADVPAISFGDEDYTVIGWIKPDTGFEWTVPLAKWTSGGNLREYYCEFLNNQLSFSVSSDGTSAGTHNVTWGTTQSAGNWYFVAIGHSASANEIWISVNAGTPSVTAHSGGTFDAGNALYVGAYTGGSAHCPCTIDEWAIYRRDLRADLSGFHNSGNGVSYADVSGGGSSPAPALMNYYRNIRIR